MKIGCPIGRGSVHEARLPPYWTSRGSHNPKGTPEALACQKWVRDLLAALSGKPDYLVRVKDGIAPVELKSSQSPSSGRPYDGHLFQLAAYCLLVEDVCRVSVPYGLVKYEDRTIRVEYTPSLRASLIALLDEIRTAKRNGECHINHNQPSKCRSCGFRSVCGEGLI